MIDRGQPRTLLERLIRDSEFTVEEWRRRFDDTAREIGESTSLSARQLQRWMAGEVDDARPVSRRVAARLWGRSFATLLAPPGDSMLSPPHSSGVEVAVGAASDADDPGLLEEVTIMAAHESSRHATDADGSVSATVVEQIQAEVWRLARGYATTPPLRMLAEARQARNLAYAALDRTRRPAQTTDLYLTAGQLCGLMAVASFDLAVWDAASEQARAAHVYAELVDHAGLRAWSRGTQALIAYWTGRPRQALVHVEAGIECAPVGTAEARLRSIEARAQACIGGDPRRVADALNAADSAHAGSQAQDDLHDGIGGEFGWGPSRHAACASTALLAAGDATGSVHRARQALSLIAEDPAGGLVSERACVDLAAAELALGNLDAAEHALPPVWQVPVAQRRHSITDRLAQAARTLSGPRWQRDHQAAQLRDRIEVFNAEAEGRALPA
jgi:hypothetical protein